GGSLPRRARGGCLSRFAVAAGARAARTGPDRLLRVAAGGSRRAARELRRRRARGRARARRLRRNPRTAAAPSRHPALRPRAGAGGPALRNATGGVRYRPGGPEGGAGALADRHVRAVVPGQAAAHAAAVPAQGRAAADEIGAGVRTAGACRRLAAADERQRAAAAQCALETGRHAGAGAARPAGRTGWSWRLAPGRMAAAAGISAKSQPALVGAAQAASFWGTWNSRPGPVWPFKSSRLPPLLQWPLAQLAALGAPCTSWSDTSGSKKLQRTSGNCACIACSTTLTCASSAPASAASRMRTFAATIAS